MGLLSKLRHYVPLQTLKGIYHALCNSHLRYSCQSWAFCGTSISHRIQLFDMKFSEFHAPSSPLFFELKILKVLDLLKSWIFSSFINTLILYFLLILLTLSVFTTKFISMAPGVGRWVSLAFHRSSQNFTASILYLSAQHPSGISFKLLSLTLIWQTHPLASCESNSHSFLFKSI